MFEDSDKVISNFKLMEKEQFINYSDDLEMIFIELPKFSKQLEELENITEQWIYFIKNAGSFQYIPDNLPEAITSAFEISNTAGLTKELDLQYKKKEFISIQKSALILAEEEEGEARGIEQGIEQTSKKLKALGIENFKISEATGLSLEKIMSL